MGKFMARKFSKDIDPDVLRQLLRYDPETGKLFWLRRPAELFKGSKDSVLAAKAWNARCAEKEAFTADNGEGYRQGSIFGRLYRASRVIWCLMTGEWPTSLVDHRDGQRDNNRWSNLRDATDRQNVQNTSSRAGSSSKYLGVFWDKDRRKWAASIKIGKRSRVIGRFASEEDAAQAYDAAAREHYGAYARANFPTLCVDKQTLLCASNSDGVGQSDGPRRA